MKNSFLIAATGSGCGKTIITCAVLELLKERGYKCRSYKCGPDYIDPMFHENVLEVPSKNLDLYFTDREMTRNLFMMHIDEDISVVEGVMGLYDGLDPRSYEASSYDLACALDIPVILVIDAKGMGRSLLAMVKGFLDMDTEKRITGIFLNRIPTSYFDRIRPVIEEELKVNVVGHFPEQKSIEVESRYLGLKLPNEIENLRAKINILAAELGKTLDLDRLLELTNVKFQGNLCKPDLANEQCGLGASPKVRIAIAKDEAFCFYYEDNLRMLCEAGAELIEFSPLHDLALPENVSGIILGGGYPELYAQRLSENTTMLESIRRAFANDIPSLAECGGFMYLHKYIQTEDGNTYPMAGVIDGMCKYMGRLVRFGYVSVKEKKSSFLQGSVSEIRGHEFHYYDSDNNGNDCISSKPIYDSSWECGFVTERHWWGFTHLYYPSNQEFPKHFVEICQNYNYH